MPRWYDESKRLAASGQQEAAYQVLRDAAAGGALEPLATLARMMWAHEPSEKPIRILEDVARRVKPQDWETNFAVHLAYSIGVGAGYRDFAQIQRQAFKHLEAAALASEDARMYLSVGLHFWQGLNGVTRDEALAQKWLEAAASSGEKDIVAEYKRFLRRKPSQRGAGAA
jgi:TPR repeat protein